MTAEEIRQIGRRYGTDPYTPDGIDTCMFVVTREIAAQLAELVQLTRVNSNNPLGLPKIGVKP